VHAERRGDADPHAGMAGAGFAREARHVAARVAARREEVGHDDDLARAGGGAGVDRVGQGRLREREVRRRDPPPGPAPREHGGDRRELPIRGALAAAVIDEHDGAPARSPRRHQ